MSLAASNAGIWVLSASLERGTDGQGGVGYLAIAWVMIPANHNERIGTPTANQGGAAEGV